MLPPHRFLTKVAVLASLFLLLPLSKVSAATIYVDSTCSLAQAINAANATANADTGDCETASSGADIIILPADGRTVLSEALPEIVTNMTIKSSAGNRHTIDGSGGGESRNYRILLVGSVNVAPNVTLENLVITKGKVTNGHGGGIYSYGSLTINNSVISDNEANGDGGGINATSGSLTINNSVISGNTASRYGGGISIYGVSLTETDPTINATIKKSDISNNRATQNGGGVAIRVSCCVNIENSTIYGNTATGNGGGIYVDIGAAATLTHLTIVNNSAATGGGIYNHLDLDSPGILKVRNSIIANNTVGDCAGSFWTENVGNLSTDDTCSAAVNTDSPRLDTLMAMSPAYYPLQPESPAVDGGSIDYCLRSDQRGMRRPQGDACDIGAYEYEPLKALRVVAAAKSISSSSPKRDPTRIPRPEPATCETLPAGILVTWQGGQPQCQRVGAAGIGHRAIARAPFIDAVDVWGWVLPNTQVCFEAAGGSFKFIDTAPIPRVVADLPAYSLNGMTCAAISGPGIVVLLPGPPAPAREAQTAAPQIANRSLSDCMVRTKYMLRFRDAPGGAPLQYTDPWGRRENGWLPSTVTLTALARTDRWFKVDYYGTQGWVGARHVSPQGACG